MSQSLIGLIHAGLDGCQLLLPNVSYSTYRLGACKIVTIKNILDFRRKIAKIHTAPSARAIHFHAKFWVELVNYLTQKYLIRELNGPVTVKKSVQLFIIPTITRSRIEQLKFCLWWSSINRRKLLLPPSHNPITTILLSECRTKFVRKINPWNFYVLVNLLQAIVLLDQYSISVPAER